MDFPSSIFPAALTPHGQKRALFAEYGMFGAANLNSDGSFISQKAPGMESSLRLCASMSSTVRPLITAPADEVERVETDPFQWKQMERRIRSVLLDKKIKFFKTRCKNSYYLREELKSLKETMDNWETSYENRNGKNPLQELPVWMDDLLTDREYLTSDTHPVVVNSWYTGGAISHQKMDNQSLLMFPSGTQQDKLVIQDMRVDGDVQFGSSDMLEQSHGKIYQVSSGSQNSNIGCLRTNSSCSFFKVDIKEDNCSNNGSIHSDQDVCSDSENSQNNKDIEDQDRTNYQIHSEIIKEKSWDKSNPTSVCMNPYLVGECAVTLSEGSVLLWSVENSSEVIRTNHQSCFPCSENWLHCHFGSHPRLIVLTDRSGSVLLDSRIQGADCMDLFVLPNGYLHKNEQIFTSKPHPTIPFCHILATNFGLMLVDERFPNHPMLHWQHLLLTAPQYIEVISGAIPASNDDVILLGSQKQPEVMCFQIGSNKETGPISTAVPWRLNTLGMPFNKTVKTADSLLQSCDDKSVTGMCGVVHDQKKGFTLLQLTSKGEVYSQCVLPSDEPQHEISDKTEIETMIQQSLQNADDMESVSESEPKEKAIFYGQDIASHVFDIIQRETYSHLMCPLCMSRSSDDVQLSADQYDDLCCMCDFKVKFSRDMKQSIEQGNISNFPTSENLDVYIAPLDDVHMTDPHSQILQKLWAGEHEGIVDLLTQQENEQKDEENDLKDQTEDNTDSHKENTRAATEVSGDGSSDQTDEDVDKNAPDQSFVPSLSDSDQSDEEDHTGVNQSKEPCDKNVGSEDNITQDEAMTGAPSVGSSNEEEITEHSTQNTNSESYMSVVREKLERKRQHSESSKSSSQFTLSKSDGFLTSAKFFSPKKETSNTKQRDVTFSESHLPDPASQKMDFLTLSDSQSDPKSPKFDFLTFSGSQSSPKKTTQSQNSVKKKKKSIMGF